MKRSRTPEDRTISPPPTKKKVESTTTGKLVANFFKRTSEKEPTKLRWKTVHETLMVGRYHAEMKESGNGIRGVKRRRGVAAFDFDSTLIKTSSGNAFGRSAEDWQWWDAVVPGRLRELHDKGYQVVIISNQAGISLKSGFKKANLQTGGDGKRLADFKGKVGYVLAQLDLPISIYAATERDGYRKPRIGMWTQMMEDYGLEELELKLGESLFVGDAAGRLEQPGKVKADHSCSDRDFAANIGIQFHTPEEYFLGEAARPFQRSIDPRSLLQIDQQPNAGEASATKPAFQPKHELEIILLCGSPGAGKSTLYETTMKPLGYQRINQDILKSRYKCLKVATTHLQSKSSIVIDNTNADPDTRKHWIDLARRFSIPIRAIHLTTPAAICRHNDAICAAHGYKPPPTPTPTKHNNADPPIAKGDTTTALPSAAQNLASAFNPEHRTILPPVAFASFQSRFSEPRVEEGFEEVVTVPFVFRGGEGMRGVWGRYWI